MALGFTLYSGHRPLSLIQGNSFYLSSDRPPYERAARVYQISLSPALFPFSEAIIFSLFPIFIVQLAVSANCSIF